MTPFTTTKSWLRPLKSAGLAAGLTAVFAFGAAGCKKAPDQAQIVNGNTGADPAAGNFAPVDGSQPTQVLGSNASYTPQQQSESYPQQGYSSGQQAPAPIVRGGDGYQQGYADDGQYSYNAPPQDNGEGYADAEAAAQTDQAPPPLPEYDQPPAPEADYLWTPGYWGYNDGYYWVPGAWCAPPYYGSLWTPPYWGFYGGHYLFHHGYWGPHIGFYGGVDYGYGYVGTGYYGGYWSGHDFYYNRSVNNIGFRGGNVYQRDVVIGGRTYGARPLNRVSYNGGPGGLRVAPRPAEMAAFHEQHVGAIPAQIQVRQAAAGNRSQFFNVNHGRPAEVSLARPVAGNRPTAEAPRGFGQPTTRGGFNQPGAQPNRGVAGQPENRGGFNQPGARPGQPETRPGGFNQPGARPGQPETRPGGVNQPTNRGGFNQPGAQPNRGGAPAAGPEGLRNNTQPQQRAVQNQAMQQRTAEAQQRNVQQQRNNQLVQQQRNTQMQQRAVPAQRAQPAQQPRVESRPAVQQPRVETPRAEPAQRQEAPRAAAAPQQHAAPAPQQHAAPAARPAGGGGGGHEGGGHPR